MDEQIKNWKAQISEIDTLITDMRGDKSDMYITVNPGRPDPIITLRQEQRIIMDLITIAKQHTATETPHEHAEYISKENFRMWAENFVKGLPPQPCKR